jgi:hypothetical protein
MSNKPEPDPQESIEQFIIRHFEENFQRLKFESGHGLSPEVKERAKRQVLLYWRRLKEVAETITDTEVRLNLPGQQTPKNRKFSVEGVVDIVREKGHTTMYDLKTHDPEYIMQNLSEYENQLNVYAHIWQNLRQQELNETAIIATQFPDSLSTAWDKQQGDPAMFEQELQRWTPVIPISFNTQHVRNTIEEFARTVDAIEDGVYSPPTVNRLNRREVRGQTFATRVCTNCDVRFSCQSYREYVKTSKSRDLPKFKDIYEDTGIESERENRLDAGLAATVPVGD